MTSKLLLVVFGCVFGIACGREQPDDTPELVFSVNEALLGEEVRLPAQEIRFRPPAGWAPLSEQDIDRVREAVDNENHAFTLDPLSAYVEADGGSLLSVARLEVAQRGTFRERMAAYGAFLEAQAGEDSLQQATFRRDAMPVAQFLHQQPDLVHFKLVVEGGGPDLVQFDFIVPRSRYPEHVRSIESVIGSIHQLL